MFTNPHIARVPYSPEELGRVEMDDPGPVIAGSMATIRLTYTAGRFGIDDQGSIRILFRFASDAGRPQFERPNAPNFCTAVASNRTLLVPEYHPRGAFRPWFKAIRVNIMRESLRQGDTIVLTLGDRAQGSAGWRTSTMQEHRFEIRVQADPWGTVVYGDVAGGASFELLPGAPVAWKAVLPTARRVGERFDLMLRADDRCGNPTKLERALRLEMDGRLVGVPESIVANGARAVRVPGLYGTDRGTVRIRVRDESGALLAVSNPLEIGAGDSLRTWWGDFHAQSEETIGTNSAREYFQFARDLAFCDFVGHQGNDFQISNAFWAELNSLYREFNDPGRFVTVPGYEYSPVTSLGGDRNIFFFEEDRPIRRSSHALVADQSDINTDCNHVVDLFAALRKAGDPVLAFAHVGGRYADLYKGHDGEIERSVEVHSAWGTFEWLLFDAFDLGYRVGVVCNSDDHKGRPGASHPGASIFGAYGGLTCLYMADLSRESIWQCLKARHHYGTTGDRLYLEVLVDLPSDAKLYEEDPKINPGARSSKVRTAMMGDIVAVAGERARVRVRIVASSPIERIDLRCGAQAIETIRPYTRKELGRRIRVVWEGAEYRGRGRMTTWDGSLTVHGNRIATYGPINFFHLEKQLRSTPDGGVTWESVTTGNFAGAELMLNEAHEGRLALRTPHVETEAEIANIGLDDLVFEAGGLGKRVRLYRLPDANAALSFEFEREFDVRERGDTPIYVRVTLENGHQAWSSPIYLFQEGLSSESR